MANYTRAIDYDAKWSREDYVQRQGNFPTFGRDPMRDTPTTTIVSGTYAWDVRNGMPVPFTRMYLDGTPYNELRQLELAITPHGFLKAAAAAPATALKAIKIQYVGASDFGLSQFGRTVTLDPEVCAYVYGNLEPLAPMLGKMGMFGEGPSGNVASSADIQTRVLDISGRRP